MQKTIAFSSDSHADLHPFSSLSECARMTLPFLTGGAIGLSGGATFASLFNLWTALSPDCRGTSYFPVDERIVPFDDPQSNWGQAYARFLEPLGNITDKNHFAASVTAYSDILERHFGGGIPVFDTLFLGIGDDGHTASLFPGGTYLDDQTTIVLQTKSPKPPYDRITLGPTVIAAAKNVIVVLAGKNKKAIAKQIFDNDLALPIVRILSRCKNSHLYISQELTA